MSALMLARAPAMALFASALALMTASRVLAQPRREATHLASPTAEAALTEARERFVRGVEHYDEGDYDGALAEFRRSYELSPVAGVLVNVAVTLEALDRYDEAVDAYRLYLSTAAHASSDRRRAVEQAMAELEQRIASVTLDVDRPGARVLIDGRSVGQTPLDQPLRLAAGARVIEVALEGFVSVREEIEVAGGVARRISIRLAPVDRNGLLRIVAEPAGAILRIDGLEVGSGPLERRVPMGGHVVEGVLAAYRTYRTEVTIADHQELDLRLVLEPAGPSLTDEAWFWVVVGVGIVGVAAAVTAGVVCTTTDACTSTIIISGNSEPGVLRL